MSVLRNIWSDLVEKKLWPVAAVLVLALVAVPLALKSSGETATPSPPAAGSPTLPEKAPPVSLDTSVRDTPKVRAGGVRDPFRQLHVPKPVKAKASASATKVTPTAAGGAAVTPSTATPSTTPSVAAPPVAPKVTWFTYRVGLRFGRAGRLKSYHDVKRLTALPSSTFPFFTFMGVLEDRNTAVFLVAADVTATGDVTCRPRKTTCQMLELKPGDSVRLTYHPSDGRDPVDYRLQLASVKQVAVKDRAKAAQAHAAVSRGGSAALKAMRRAHLVPQIHRYVYDASKGLLLRAHGEQAAKAASVQVPARYAADTPWGWIAKLDGGVYFSPKK